MKLVKVKGKWYVNRCYGKTTKNREFRNFCKRHQSECRKCPFAYDNPFLEMAMWGREEKAVGIGEDEAIALLRGFYRTSKGKTKDETGKV